MRKKQAIIIIVGVVGITVLVTIGFVGCYALSSVVAILDPSNERDNNDPAKRKEMAKLSCEWGRLAPFPESKRGFTIKTEGSPFTRSFRGSFFDSRDVIQQWMLNSPGIQEGEMESMPDKSSRYNLKMGGGACYGEVIISPQGDHVSFYIAWS
jgi:hypothetical protein